MAVDPLSLVLPTSPLTFAETGEMRPEWRRFFQGIVLRTGGGPGLSLEDIQRELDAEEVARASGDQALGIALASEAATRKQDDDALRKALQQETNQRTAADSQLRFLVDDARSDGAAAVADMVPKSQLCSLWAQCDLSFLPSSDPGLGRPWLDDNHLVVGTSASAMTFIGLEDGSGVWAGEGVPPNDWVWG